MEEIETRIRAVIDRLKPFLMSDGGMIEFVKYEDGIAYVRMLGACAGCDFITSYSSSVNLPGLQRIF